VTLRVGPGIYLHYRHIMPGSVRVRVGERVRRGQVLGQLGNSGNSATPHVHFQVQIARSFVSDGLPFVFKRFKFLGQITEPFSDATLGLRPNGQMPLPQPVGRVHAAARCRLIAVSCDFRTRGRLRGGRGWEGRAVGPELDGLGAFTR